MGVRWGNPIAKCMFADHTGPDMTLEIKASLCATCQNARTPVTRRATDRISLLCPRFAEPRARE